MNTITGRVVATRYAGRSTMGNPRYDVAVLTESGEVAILTTATNASIGYGITNPEYRDTLHTFKLDKLGRIAGVL